MKSSVRNALFTGILAIIATGSVFAAVSMVVNQRNSERGFPQKLPHSDFGIMEGPEVALSIA